MSGRPRSVDLRRTASRCAPVPAGGSALPALLAGSSWAVARVRAAGLARGDETLVPAYHHGSEIEVLVRASLTCRFYRGTTALAPDEEKLDALVGGNTRALLLIHYLGFPQDAARWRDWCHERGLVLVEDAAQAWLATTADGPVGSLGEVAVFCLYKMYGLPDGAALVAPGPPDESPLRATLGLGLLVRRHLAWIRSRGPLEANGASRVASSASTTPAEEFGLGIPTSRRRGRRSVCSGGSPARMRPFVGGRLRAAARSPRRARPTSFQDLPSGACPFVFPVATAAKPRFSAPSRRRYSCLRLLVDPSSVATDGRVSAGAGAAARGHRPPSAPGASAPRSRSDRRSSPCRRA